VGLLTEIQVVVLPVLQEPFREWLASRRLYLYQIPGKDDDLPTYGIGAKDG
jgi:hypothetical protein